MYFRKALLDQRPIITMTQTGTWYSVDITAALSTVNGCQSQRFRVPVCFLNTERFMSMPSFALSRKNSIISKSVLVVSVDLIDLLSCDLHNKSLNLLTKWQTAAMNDVFSVDSFATQDLILLLRGAREHVLHPSSALMSTF